MSGLNQMQTGQKLQAALAQRYGVQSPVAPALATEVFPVVQASDSQIDPELQFLQGTTLGVGLGLDPAVVAQQSHVGLENPANSGVIVVVQQIRILNDSGATQNWWIRIEGGALVAPDFSNAGWQRDSRNGANRRTTANIVTLTGVVAPGNGVMQVRVVQGGEGVVNEPWILAPQSRIWTHIDGGNNLPQRTSFLWRERAIETWELIGAV